MLDVSLNETRVKKDERPAKGRGRTAVKEEERKRWVRWVNKTNHQRYKYLDSPHFPTGNPLLDPSIFLRPAFSSFSGFLPLIPLLGVALIMYPRVKIISIFYFFIVAAETALNSHILKLSPEGKQLRTAK